jgi:hypothetical protein
MSHIHTQCFVVQHRWSQWCLPRLVCVYGIYEKIYFWHQNHEYRGTDHTPTFIPNTSTRCTLFLNFLPCPYYAQGYLFYPLNGSCVGPLTGLDTFGGNSLPQSSIRTCIMQSVCSLVTSDYSIPDTEHLWEDIKMSSPNTACSCGLR